MLFLFVVVTACFGFLVKGEPLSATESYDFAISSESQLSLLKLKETHVNNLQSYKKVLKKHLQKIRRAIKQSEELLKSTKTSTRNLIYGYKVLRHLHNDWPQYFRLLKKDLGLEQIAVSQKLLTQQPTSVDFEESMGAMHRLQTVYNLDSYAMTEGFIDAKDRNIKNWSADECLMLGLMYLFLKDYNQSENWLELALYHYDDNLSPEVLKIKLWNYPNLLESLVEANKGLGRYLEAKKYANELLSINPNHTYMLTQLPKLKHLQSNPIKLTKPKKVFQLQKEICSKRYRRKSGVLVCRYVDWTQFLKLAPLKMEELSMKPHISIFYGFLGQKDIEVLKNASRPKLQRVKHLSGNCSCKIGNLSSSSHDVVRKVNELILDITGFPSKGNQMLEVINYGIAGNYNPEDTAKPKIHNKANAFIFLENAGKGGEIVFPSRHLKVRPRKGSMLFWENLKNSVIYHQCPILKGNMWVANKVLN
ncbi:prolyl 4-hydroxylase subunit alpha-1 isoform X1 [Drosophila sechellia]|uniref:prolyl 4-hydroxylase subunit alpha-1 isoform X1 n=2 Tax=Drosophila sechellia TaxID=7238 RepID=UPI0013DE3EBF|nr:prolyl 4-hydroxylase subunit alpha-1 isoform X1 [Drosophila sechellia]